jgi:AraC-like DNA-binding protein
MQALRLSSTVESMATSSDPLADIAAKNGYADQSHFSRACRDGLGLTPRQTRTLLSQAIDD